MSYKETTHEDFKSMRAKLREKLLTNSLLGDDQTLEFTATFDGYGDSGNFNNDADDPEINALLSEAVDLFVHFDWYNNEGGGGDLTWDVRADKIIINGYQNETQRVDAMSEEEF